MSEIELDPNVATAIWESAYAQAEEELGPTASKNKVKARARVIEGKLKDTISVWMTEHPGVRPTLSIIASIIILKIPDASVLEGDTAIDESTLKWMTAAFMTIYFALVKLLEKMVQDILKMEGELRGAEIEVIGATAALKAEAIMASARAQASIYLTEGVMSLVSAAMILATIGATAARARQDPNIQKTKSELDAAKAELATNQNDLSNLQKIQKGGGRVATVTPGQPDPIQRDITSLQQKIGTPASKGKEATGLYAKIQNAEKALKNAEFSAYSTATQTIEPFRRMFESSIGGIQNCIKAGFEIVKGEWDAFREIMDMAMRTAEQVIGTSSEESRQARAILQALFSGIEKVMQQIHQMKQA